MSNETDTLETILDGETPASAVETPQPEQRPETQTGVKDNGEAPPAEPNATNDESDESPLIPRRALIDERRKRQELETRLKELEQAARPQHQQREQQRPYLEIPDPVTEPERFAAWQNAQFQGHLYAQKVVISQRMMRERHPDYDEYESIFADAAQHDPSLRQQLIQSEFPAEFAYQMGRKIKTMLEIGDDPEAYIEAKLAERMSQAQGQTPKTAVKGAVPKSLAGVRSAQPRDTGGRFTAEPSLSDILD